MTSPSKPLSIKNAGVVRGGYGLGESVTASFANSAIGTPDVRSRRQGLQFAGTPPPNIPPRARAIIPGTASPSVSLPPSDIHTPQRGGPSTFGGISAARPSGSQTPVDVDDLPEEEKIKVLRRHLALHQDRPLGETSSAIGTDAEVPDSDSRARTPSTAEPFPIPYYASGADVT